MSDFWDYKLPANYYDKNLLDGLSLNRGIQANWHNITFINVKNKMGSDKKHLDYACGPGTFIGNYILNDSVGLDISVNQIDFAKQKYSKHGKFFCISDIDLKSYNGHFQTITVIGLLEYLDTREATELLETLYKLLSDDGKIILTTPNYGVVMRILEFLSHKIGRVDYSSEHKNKYTEKKLMRFLSKSKFTDIKTKKILNLGIVFSFFSIKFGCKVVDRISTFNGYRRGLLFLIELQK
jgi:2-polyprenyl-3-methyl-5-hydroxy-6-metoxy-1,4-benzoquinol methylase